MLSQRAWSRNFGKGGPTVRFVATLRQQSEAPKAGMALAADHQVVVDRDAELLGCRLDLARHLDVVA